jgi:hypothetical protein
VAQSLFDHQTRNNRETAGLWDLYAEHRRKVTRLLVAGDSQNRLCVLGAGNANAFDLAVLAERFAEVHLCDLDPDALARATERQTPATREKLVLHAPLDLSGLLAHLPAWAATPPGVDELTAFADATATHLGAALPGPFDVVVSEGLLSQIYWSCFSSLGNGPALRTVIPAALVAHLSTLVTLTSPGRSSFLVTDTAAPDGLPLEDLSSEPRGLALLDDLDRQGKLFTGTGPALVRGALRHRLLAGRVEEVRVVAPWLWQFLPQRSAVVYAVELRARRA